MPEQRAPLHVWEMGQGTPLVLVHGGLSNGRLAWQRTAEALAPYHRVVVVDRRGHGRSPRRPRSYDIAGDAADLADIAARLQLPRFHLVGHSYGAVVAYDLAVRSPHRLASLHLIEPPMLAVASDAPEVEALIQSSAALWEEAEGLSRGELTSRFLGMVAGDAFVEQIKGRPVWHELVAEAERLPFEQNPATYQPPPLDAAGLRLPVRVYSGGRSHPALRIVAERLAASVSGAMLVHVATAYHEVHKSGPPFEEALLAVTQP